MMRKGRWGEDQRSEAEAYLLLLIQGCLKLWWVDPGPTRDAAQTKDGDVQGPLPGSVECGVTHFSTSSAAKASVNSGSFSTVSCRDLPSPFSSSASSICQWLNPTENWSARELESRFSKIPEQMGEEQASGCTVQVNNQHKGKWAWKAGRWKVGMWRCSPPHWLWKWNENVSHSVVFNSLWSHRL